jgi:hypothetical protein
MIFLLEFKRGTFLKLKAVLSYLLVSWSIVLLVKLIGFELVNKFPTFMDT